MLDYTAIDFETANSYRGSPCSVGLVRVRNGRAVEKRHWLVRPPESADWFDGWNTAIHGITAEMVADAPRWKGILPHLVDFIGDDVVVAHNAGFDIGVIRYACAMDNIGWPEMRFLCTLVMARRVLALPTYRLPFIAGSTPIEVNTDSSGYLYGRVVVFTGTLLSMSRDIARQECAKVGAVPERNTTKRTNVLVVGDINPAVLRPGSNVTGKARKAFELQDKGQEIEVMTEDDFLRCLDGNVLDGTEVLLERGDEQPETEPAASVPSRLRSVPPERTPLEPAKPRIIKPPRPLRRTPIPTYQVCSVESCGAVAAFKTQTKPTWCEAHIKDTQSTGGVRPLESFTHPDDWQLTECLACGVEAHYRFNYTLEKNNWNEPTCRACYWRKWAADVRGRQGAWADRTPVSYEEAKAFIEDHGFDYLGPLTAPSYRDDPHHTKCRRCGKISAERRGDIGFGCTCQPRN